MVRLRNPGGSSLPGLPPERIKLLGPQRRALPASVPLPPLPGSRAPGPPASAEVSAHSPEVSCIQAQILYTVAVLQKKKRVKQMMQAMMSIMERPMKKEELQVFHH